MFLGLLNNYSAGLSWYYFLANMVTFAQTWIMQNYVIDSDALHAKIQENKKKPVKVSKFQERLEQMAKERQQQGTLRKNKHIFLINLISQPMTFHKEGYPSLLITLIVTGIINAITHYFFGEYCL